jgi:hypothetical protein
VKYRKGDRIVAIRDSIFFKEGWRGTVIHCYDDILHIEFDNNHETYYINSKSVKKLNSQIEFIF